MEDNAKVLSPEEKRQQQIEVLKMLKEYSPKLINGIKTVANELKGEKLGDTDDFFKDVITGINWELNAVNACMDFINEDSQLINKEEANNVIVKFSDSVVNKDDKLTSELLINGILPLIDKFTEIATIKTA